MNAEAISHIALALLHEGYIRSLALDTSQSMPHSVVSGPSVIMMHTLLLAASAIINIMCI